MKEERSHDGSGERSDVIRHDHEAVKVGWCWCWWGGRKEGQNRELKLFEVAHTDAASSSDMLP